MFNLLVSRKEIIFYVGYVGYLLTLGEFASELFAEGHLSISSPAVMTLFHESIVQRGVFAGRTFCRRTFLGRKLNIQNFFSWTVFQTDFYPYG